MTTLLEAARALARSVHCDQQYGVGRPYTHHLAAVEEVLRRFCWLDDEELLAAAWLHDTLEDTALPAAQIALSFGEGVLGIVQAVTDEPRPTRRARFLATAPKIRAVGRRALALKLADRIANVEASASRPSLLSMYRREWPALRSELYTDHAELAVMWRHLSDLLA